MKDQTWIASVSAAVAVASFLYSLWNGRRTSDASLRARNADLRAEEALQVAKAIEERDRQRYDDEKADIDAPQIDDRWATEIGFLWSARSRNGTYEISKTVKMPAERRAVEILRASKETLNLIGITYDASREVCTISGWNFLGYKRHKHQVGNPPKLGGAG